MLLNIALFLAFYILVSYAHIQLYKRNVSIFWIRVVLVSALLIYIGFWHKPNDIWSSAECYTIGAFIAAHLLTGDYHSVEKLTKVQTSPHDSSKTESHSSFSTWLSSFIIFAWILGDDDDE